MKMGIVQILKRGKILVSDGAWGTQLHQRGLAPGECPELWNLTHPDEVLSIAHSYLEAGAQLVKTNSFGASRYKLDDYGLAEKVTELNRVAASISAKAAADSAYVLGSIGPSGKMLLMEEITAEELYEAFREQALALQSGGADALLVETMTDIGEAVLAVRAAKENTRCEVFCTMTFDRTSGHDYHSIMGVSPEEMTKKLIAAGADAVGANCGQGIKEMTGVVKKIRQVNPHIPIIVHANAGMPQYIGGKTVFTDTPEEMSAHVQELIFSGAGIIGGCCGTGPEHIRKMADIIRANPTEE